MRPRSLLPWLVVALSCSSSCGPGPTPPSIELGTMEAPVEQALTRAREAVLEQRRSSEAWGELGATFHAHRLFDEAVLCYDRAIELDEDDFRWVYFVAIAREASGAGSAEVLERFEAAAELLPGYPPIYVRLGAATSQRGLIDDARRAYTRALELDPRFAVAHRGLGQLLLASGDAETAAEHLAQAVRLNPEDGAAYAALAQSRLRLGEPFLAERDAERARGRRANAAIPDPVFEAEVATRSVSSLRALTRAVRLIGDERFEEALEALEVASKTRSWDPEVHYWIGVAQGKLGRNDEAVERLRRVVELREDHLGAHVGLGRLLEKAGLAEAAAAHLTRAAELSPRDAAIQLRLGLLLARSGRPVTGLEHLEEAVRLRPEDPDFLFVLGQAHLALGERGPAIEQFERAVAIAPDHRSAQSLDQLKNP